MNKNDIAQKLKTIIVESATRQVNISEINEKTNFILDMDFDSISLVNLYINIESDFQITFENEKLVPEVIGDFNVLLDYVSMLIKHKENQKNNKAQ